MSGAIDRVYARLIGMVRGARIAATRDDAPVQLAQVRLSNLETHDRLPNLAHYGLASRPLPGAEAVVLTVSAERSGGIVIATSDQRYHFALVEGEVAMHTDEGDSVHLRRGRVIAVTAGTRVQVTAPDATFSGNVEIAGTLSVTGDISGAARIRDQVGWLSDLRQHYNIHVHTDPQGGSTGPATPQD